MKSYKRPRGAALILYSAVVLCALIPGGRTEAQVSTPAPMIWSSNEGYLGIQNLRCDCTFRSQPDASGRLYIFRSEPIVLGVVPRSPAAGILMRGDTIAQIDGVSLLSVEGARRFGSIRVRDDVNFLIRRRGKLLRVSIRAGRDLGHRVYGRMVTPEADGDFSDVWEGAPSVPAAPSIAGVPAPRMPRAPRAGEGVWSDVGAVPPAEPAEPAIPAVPAIPAEAALPATPAPRALAPGAPWFAATVPTGAPSPSGWFGFSIRCNDCGWASSGRPGESPVWESDEPPELSMVAARSPAGRAGLRAGDRITHIDGVSILTPAGRRRFGRVVPGQKVRLTVLRDGTSLTKELTLGTRPEVSAAIAAVAPVPPTAPVPPSMRRELRYSGKLKDVTVEIFSPGGPTVERVGNTMIITVGASVVRLKVDPGTR